MLFLSEVRISSVVAVTKHIFILTSPVIEHNNLNFRLFLFRVLFTNNFNIQMSDVICEASLYYVYRCFAIKLVCQFHVLASVIYNHDYL